MAGHTHTVRIEPAEEGGHDVFVPALPGCVTQGEAFEEAVAMAEEAIGGYLEALAKVGEPVPGEDLQAFHW
jgi:predicted RNase H-like HicB family nuclease